MSGPKLPPERGSVLLQLETSKVFVSGVNVRRSPGDVTDLMQSISEKGILEPLLVRPVEDRYELIVGSRRFEAAKRLGMKEVPAIVRAMGDEDALIVSLVENVQRRDVEPEEEYDALMKLKKLNPALYSTVDQLARAIGKSRQYVEDRVAAVETVRTIRRGSKKSTIAVMQSPTREERKEGVLPIKHAAFLHKAEEAPLVQKLPEEKRAKKLSALAETIAELPRHEAQEVVERFVLAPQRPIEEIKRETEALRASKIEIVLDPRVADGLRRAAEERKTTVEAIVSLAIQSWLRQNRYN
ncbi:MAG: ParB/RepB/Spo0J family partition protein [Nitrososphaerales archaeon]